MWQSIFEKVAVGVLVPLILAGLYALGRAAKYAFEHHLGVIARIALAVYLLLCDAWSAFQIVLAATYVAQPGHVPLRSLHWFTILVQTFFRFVAVRIGVPRRPLLAEVAIGETFLQWLAKANWLKAYAWASTLFWIWWAIYIAMGPHP